MSEQCYTIIDPETGDTAGTLRANSVPTYEDQVAFLEIVRAVRAAASSGRAADTGPAEGGGDV